MGFDPARRLDMIALCESRPADDQQRQRDRQHDSE